MGDLTMPDLYMPDERVVLEPSHRRVRTYLNGQAVADSLGEHNALLLKNHGVVVVGASVEEACVTAIVLEKAARMQLLARQYGEIEWTSEAEALQKKRRIYNPEAFGWMWAYFLRRLMHSDKLP